MRIVREYLSAYREYLDNWRNFATNSEYRNYALLIDHETMTIGWSA